MESLYQIAIVFKTIDHTTRALNEISQAAKKVEQNIQSAKNRLQEFGEKLKGLQDKAQSLEGIVGATAWTGAFAGIIKSFTDLESAQTRLKMTFMEAGGVIPEIFKEIDKEAQKLGEELPGTTADFYNLAAKMKQLGVKSESIAKGGLRSAAYLAAVLEVPYEVAGEAVAKFKQALGIADQDLIKFMDTVQRTAHLGVSLTQMQYSFAELSGTLKILGWQGLEYANQLAPLVGRFIQLGYSGETVGTNLSKLFESMLDPKKVQKFTAELEKYGIQLKLIDEQTGKLRGPTELIAEFDKISQAFKAGIISQQELYSILSKLTGAGGEDLKMLATLVVEGAEGYNEMSAAMARQADLQKRVQEITRTLKNLWDAFTGTATAFFAAIGAQIAPTLKKITNFLNALTGATKQFFEKHQTLAKVLAYTIGVFALVAGGAVALSLAITALLFPFRILITTVQIVGPFLKFGSVLNFLISVFYKLGQALLFVGKNLLAFGRFLLANPIFLIITAIALSVYLIYRYWSPISSFFQNLWKKILSTLSSAWNWLTVNWQKVLQVFLWTNPITAPIMALQKLVKFVWGINLFTAGQKIIRSLWEGMKSLASKPVQLMKDIAQKIRNFLPFSPAKEGPLSDIHRIKFIETIAQTIQPAPLITQLSMALSAVKTSIQPLVQPVKPSTPYAQPVNISINLGGIHIAGKMTTEEAKTIAFDLEKEIRKVLEKISLERFRRAY